jgi:hypothetical protein
MADLHPPFDFECPFCERPTTVTREDYEGSFVKGLQDPTLGCLSGSTLREVGLGLHFVRCPNSACRRVSVRVDLMVTVMVYYPAAPSSPGLARAQLSGANVEWVTIHERWIHPESRARVFPEYVPAAIREDYREACLIEQHSPKAAATLARRAIQGMIRNVFKVERRDLYQEIDAIRSDVHPDTWNAIDGVRQAGNVGAHMRRNIDEIVDVSPDEARALIQLVEALVEDWYVTPYKRRQLMGKVTAIGNAKADAAGKPKRRHPDTAAPADQADGGAV